MTVKRLMIFLAAIVLVHSCDAPADARKGSVVAKVYDQYLYSSDLDGVVPKETPARDSQMLVRSYVDGWIRKKLLIRQAEKNLTSEQRDFSAKLEDYRNSLITYAYESELVKQKLDTIVTDTEISSYYMLNKASFELKYNIVKVIYVVLNEDSKELRRFKNLLSASDPVNTSTIDLLAKQHAVSYYIGDETWVRLDDLLQTVPIETFNQELFLKNNSYVEINDKPFVYLIRIKDYKISESISPLEVEVDNIRNIIINKRKQTFLRSMHEELYNNALKEKVFEIYQQ